MDDRLIKGSWLDEYIEYTRIQESPEIFHKWVGLSIVSAALERNVVLDMGAYKVYPNLYVILVAASAKCKKSTAMDIGRDLLILLTDKISIFAQKITPEALIQKLARRRKVKGKEIVRNSTSLIHADELSVFLGKERYNEGLIQLLTTLYNCPDEWEYETKHGLLQQLSNVLVGMIAGTTPAWLKGSLSTTAVEGGFTARLMFIYADTPRPPITLPVLPVFKRKKLLHDLNIMRQMKGKFTWGPNAFEWYDKWYQKKRASEGTPELLEGYLFRNHTTLLKITLLLCTCEGDDRVIQVSHLVEGLTMLKEAETYVYKAIRAIEESTKGSDLQKIYDFIVRKGEVQEVVLLKAFSHRFTAKETREYLVSLRDSEMIKEYFKDVEIGGRMRKKTHFAPVEVE